MFTDVVRRMGAMYFTDVEDNRLPTSRATAREGWRTTNRARQQLRVAVQRIPEELQPDREEDWGITKKQCRGAGKHCEALLAQNGLIHETPLRLS